MVDTVERGVSSHSKETTHADLGDGEWRSRE